MLREHREAFPPQRGNAAESSHQGFSGEDIELDDKVNDLVRTAQKNGYALVSCPDDFGEPSIYSYDGAYLANKVRKGTKRPPIIFVPLGSSEAIPILISELRKGTSYEAFFKSLNETPPTI